MFRIEEAKKNNIKRQVKFATLMFGLSSIVKNAGMTPLRNVGGLPGYMESYSKS
jgi:hypothetical protein